MHEMDAHPNKGYSLNVNTFQNYLRVASRVTMTMTMTMVVTMVVMVMMMMMMIIIYKGKV